MIAKTTANTTTIKDEEFSELCGLLLSQLRAGEKVRRDAKVKEILVLIGKGLVLAVVLTAPGSARGFRFALDREEYPDSRLYNERYLTRNIRRLEKQKDVSIRQENDTAIISLTSQGKKKILKYAINDFIIEKPSRWDGKWRVVIYDVPRTSNKLREILRNTLKGLGFLKIQESVYVIPYECSQQIEFIRHYYRLGEIMNLLTVTKMDYERAYREYFGI